MVHGLSITRPMIQPVRVTAPKTGQPSNTSSSSLTASVKATDSNASSAADDFKALFTPKINTNATPPPPPPPPPPTAESVFGPNPWVTNPTGIGPNGNTYGYNPYYFATPQTAAKVAQMLGGTVVPSYEFTPNGGMFAQQQPNLMVQLPNGHLVNAGIIAACYTHGYPQSYVDSMIAAEVQGS